MGSRVSRETSRTSCDSEIEMGFVSCPLPLPLPHSRSPSQRETETHLLRNLSKGQSGRSLQIDILRPRERREGFERFAGEEVCFASIWFPPFVRPSVIEKRGGERREEETHFLGIGEDLRLLRVRFRGGGARTRWVNERLNRGRVSE